MRELEIFNYLTGRLIFSKVMSQTYYRLKRGAEGEKEFLQMVPDEIAVNFSQWKDLNLLNGGQEVQIDVLWIGQGALYHFEIKNYSGDYILQNEQWQKLGFGEIENPLYQMQRANIFLKKLFRKHQIDLPIYSKLIFIHPEFHLYQSDYQLPIYLRSQLKSLFFEVMGQTSSLNFDKEKLERIIQAHRIENSKYAVRPKYDYERMQKGLKCKKCRTGLKSKTERKFICSKCHNTKSTKEVLDLHVAELKLLFPEMKLTKGLLYDWCGEQIKMRTIQKYLAKYHITIFNGKSSYYLSKM